MSTPNHTSSRAEQSPSNGKPVGGEHVELNEIHSSKLSLPVEEDIMQLARLGEIGAIQKLFDSGKFDANSADEQGITPLHVRPRKHFNVWEFSRTLLIFLSYLVGCDQ